MIQPVKMKKTYKRKEVELRPLTSVHGNSCSRKAIALEIVFMGINKWKAIELWLKLARLRSELLSECECVTT